MGLRILGGGSGGGVAGVSSFNTRTGPVALAKADVTGTGLAAADVGADASGAAATAQAASLQKTSNLADVASASTSRTNLGLGTAATQASTAFDVAGAAAAAQAASAQTANNLSDLASAPTARTNLGLGTAATQATGAFDAAGAAATAQAASLQKTSNLSDLASAATALTNLGALASANYQLGVVAADITISSQTTLQTATGLALTLGASSTEIWLVKFWALLNAANATMDAKVGLSLPTACTAKGGPLFGNTVNGAGWGAVGTASSPVATGTGNAIAFGTLAGTIAVPAIYVVFGGGTAGSVQFQFAQNTSDAGNLVLQKGSIMEAAKVAA